MASVTFKRGTRAEIEATAKQDGQILMETDQNKKNKMYIDLPDGSRVLIGNSGEAIDTSYDNTTSGLDATNVQNAIDKIENNVGDISGITDSLTATSSNIALSAAGGNNLQGQIDTLKSNLSNVMTTVTNLGSVQASEPSTPVKFTLSKSLDNFKYVLLKIEADGYQDIKMFPVKILSTQQYISGRGYYLKAYSNDNHFCEVNVGFYTGKSVCEVTTLNYSGWKGKVYVYGIN